MNAESILYGDTRHRSGRQQKRRQLADRYRGLADANPTEFVRLCCSEARQRLEEIIVAQATKREEVQSKTDDSRPADLSPWNCGPFVVADLWWQWTYDRSGLRLRIVLSAAELAELGMVGAFVEAAETA